jgi:hypothetical protein
MAFLMFEEVNLSPKTTGLPTVIYISVKGNSKHFARIKASSKRGNKLKADSLITITIDDNPVVIGDKGDLTTKNIHQLIDFVIVNKQNLLDYWNELIDAAELIDRIR